MAGKKEEQNWPTKCIGPKLFDAKCTRLACLLSFASLFRCVGIPVAPENSKGG